MSDQSRIDVNKICKAIDALTKEIHLLRKSKNEGLKTNVDGRSVRDCCGYPPYPEIRGSGPAYWLWVSISNSEEFTD